MAEHLLRKKPDPGEGRDRKQPGNRFQELLDNATKAFRPEALQRLERRLAGDPDADPQWQRVEQAIARLREQQALQEQSAENPREDDPEMIRLLLDRGADIEGRPGSYGRPLVRAARSGRLNTLRMLLARGAEIDTFAQGLESETPLTAACASNRMEVVQLLLEQGADYRQQDGHGNTGLHTAARCGHIAIMQRMLSLGLEVDLLNANGVSPFAFAAMAGHKGAMRFLKDKRASIGFLEAVALDDLSTARGMPPPTSSEQKRGWAFPLVHWAIRHGNTEALRLLVERGLRLTLDHPEAWSLLHTVILRGDTQRLQLLMPKGQTIKALVEIPSETERISDDASDQGAGTV